jgi:hypothetical protein
MRARLLSIAACTVATVLVLCACSTKPKLPLDPGLSTDDFGVGISIGMDYSAAQAVASKLNDSRICWVLTRDEFADRSPYTERPPEQDLVVAMYAADDAGSGGEAASGAVSELRFFLAAPGVSQVRLLGKDAAPLTPGDVIAWLGPPANQTDANDGKTHLTYYFAPQEKNKPGLKLVTSHDLDGHCFAFAVSLEQTLPR